MWLLNVSSYHASEVIFNISITNNSTPWLKKPRFLRKVLLVFKVLHIVTRCCLDYYNSDSVKSQKLQNHTIFVKLLIFVDFFCVFLVF